MKTIKYNSPHLPKTAEGLRARIAELAEARRAIDKEIKDLIGSGLGLGLGKAHTCVRCGHTWTPSRVTVFLPKQCRNCHSTYWNKPRTYELKKRLAQQLPANDVEDGILPPPVAPMSLRERLSAVSAERRDVAKSTYEVIE